jgi:hypothetical protein
MNLQNSRPNSSGNIPYPTNGYVPKVNTMGNMNFPFNSQNHRTDLNRIPSYASM